MARKPFGPKDINEYYETMGARPESETWEMPFYNDTSGKPITGVGRRAPKNSGNFKAPAYNHQGKPIISNNDGSNTQNGSAYRVEVFRPGPTRKDMFTPPKYNDTSGKPVINDSPQDSNSNNVFRPSELKKTGVYNSQARQESLLALGENRKVFLNNNFSAEIPGGLIPIGSFSKISGIEVEWELESFREGGENNSEYLFPRQIRNSRLIFEYGMGFLDPLFRWFNMTEQGIMLKSPLMIYLKNEHGLPVKLWMVLDAMPVKYSAPQFDALASEVAITRLEFIHGGLINIL
ncbi:phage tail protein [Desulfosporosinus sp. PR]|uniref:phage tail protein n=1 Tax=Candidatus Desulfosporosinus nitrosoreducens TaxID=3401928 RepID=UPI0027F5AF0B|nr:phage tail protein [Desulfosporosinus sp. PR]MDQ7096759.1 phage tail protein [Desulfosporosinus sp. PR]